MRLILGLILMAFLFNCSTQRKAPTPDAPTEAPTPVDVVVVEDVKLPTNPKMPVYKFASKSTPDEYPQALIYLKNEGNSDDFYKHLTAKRSYFAHAPGLTVSQAISKFRDCLNKGASIEVRFYTPTLPSRTIGSWNGKFISQNTKIIMNSMQRAGHLLHETSHKCGFIHSGNYANRNDNQNSFPYAVGDEFENYLQIKYKKIKPRLAGEI